MDEQSQGMQGPTAPPFQPQKALRPDMGYNTLANFRIEKKIGRGQFSEVYRATCLLDGVPVALKKVQIFDLMDAKARADCIKEIDLLKPKLSMAKCRRNVENFLDACRKLGIPEEKLCLPHHILEEKGLVKVSITVQALLDVTTVKQALFT